MSMHRRFDAGVDQALVDPWGRTAEGTSRQSVAP